MTITVATEACWVVLIDGHVKDHPYGGAAHYDHAEALDEVDDHPEGVASAKQLDKPCVTVTCATCKERFFDEPDSSITPHFDTVDEATNNVVGYEWAVVDGISYCDDHAPRDEDSDESGAGEDER